MIYKNIFKHKHLILLMFFSSILCCCYGIHSQLDKTENGIFQQKTICLIMRIQNNEGRIFKSTLEENLPISDTSKCNYVINLMLIKNIEIKHTLLSGISAHNMPTTRVVYSIFRFDPTDKKQQQVLNNVIKEPSLIKLNQHTGKINRSMSRRMNEEINYMKTIMDYNNAYTKDNNKLKKELKFVYRGSSIEQNSYIANPLIPTTETQMAEDVNKQLARKLANNISSSISFAIMKDIENQEKEKTDEESEIDENNGPTTKNNKNTNTTTKKTKKINS